MIFRILALALLPSLALAQPATGGLKVLLVEDGEPAKDSKGLAKHKVDYIFLTMKEAGHGFRSKELTEKVREFLAHHLMGEPSKLASGTVSLGR